MIGLLMLLEFHQLQQKLVMKDSSLILGELKIPVQQMKFFQSKVNGFNIFITTYTNLEICYKIMNNIKFHL